MPEKQSQSLSRESMKPIKSSHKGNKAALPSKPCAVCGRTMTWRKKWEKNWAEVKYCSDACRKRSSLV